LPRNPRRASPRIVPGYKHADEGVNSFPRGNRRQPEPAPVEGFLINEPELNSPDAVNSQGKLPTELGTSVCENGRTAAGLSDVVFHTRAIAGGLVEPCSKFTAPFDDPIGIGDAVVVTPYLKFNVSGACD
jgi:hypothetical protein